MPEPIINLAAIEPLIAPHEEPNRHRARAPGDQPAQPKKGRRPSRILIAQSLRSHVKAWRETEYPGAAEKDFQLLAPFAEHRHFAGLWRSEFQREVMRFEAFQVPKNRPALLRNTAFGDRSERSFSRIADSPHRGHNVAHL